MPLACNNHNSNNLLFLAEQQHQLKHPLLVDQLLALVALQVCDLCMTYQILNIFKMHLQQLRLPHKHLLLGVGHLGNQLHQLVELLVVELDSQPVHLEALRNQLKIRLEGLALIRELCQQQQLLLGTLMPPPRRLVLV